MNNSFTKQSCTELLPAVRGKSISNTNLMEMSDNEHEEDGVSSPRNRSESEEKISNGTNHVQIDEKINGENASEKLYTVEFSEEMVLGAKRDISFKKCCRGKDSKGHARISAVSPKMQDEGLKEGMYLIMVGKKNVTFTNYERQLEIITHYANSDKMSWQLTFCATSPFHYYLPKTPRSVGIRVEIRSISKIDTVHESFNCRFFLKFIWQPSRQEAEYYDEEKKWDEGSWSPEWEFPNADIKCCKLKKLRIFDDNKRSRSNTRGEDYILIKNGQMGPTGFVDPMRVDHVFMGCIEVNASFSEVMELERFPFDTQDLTITIWSTFTSAEMQIIPYSDFFEQEEDFIFLSTAYCSATTEWDIGKPIIEIKTTQLCLVDIRSKVVRRPQVFFWRMMLPLSLIAMAAEFSFFLDLSDGAKRIAYCFTAVLASVVFQMKIYADLPNISHMTYLDWYILGLFLFMLGIALETGIFTLLFNRRAEEDHKNYIRYIDGIIAWVFAIIFIVFQIFSFCMAKVALSKEGAKLVTIANDKITWTKVGAWKKIKLDLEDGWTETYTELKKSDLRWEDRRSRSTILANDDYHKLPSIF